jgi:hypothetical protein
MRIILCCLSILVCLPLLGQDAAALEQRIAGLQTILAEGETEAERLEASEGIAAIIKESSEVEGLFTHPFDELINIGVLESGDGEFRFFNWNVPLDGERFTYRALLLFSDGQVVELEDSLELTRELESRVLNASEWYGALYYEIHPVKEKKRKYYTLVGWDGNNSLSNKKVLDALVIDKKKNVQLGLDVFQNGNIYLRRRVFEYSDKAIMTLRYVEPKEAIVFDVLEPLQAGLKGQYQFYGPSTIYSGYVLEKDGTWRLEEVVDMSRPKDAEKGAQFNFPDRPDINRQRKKVNPLTGQ